MLIGYRPTDAAYDAHSGAVFHPQDEGGNGTLAYYEIQNSTDEIDFDISEQAAGLENPVVQLNTIWGDTAFDVVDRGANTTLISEVSGFDSDVWWFTLPGATGELRLTNFADTQAAFLPFVQLYNVLD